METKIESFATETDLKKLWQNFYRSKNISEKTRKEIRERIDELVKCRDAQRYVEKKVGGEMGKKPSVPENCFRMFIPNMKGKNYTPHYVPMDCLEHKEYPTCKCGRKFVPIVRGDKECLYCKHEKETMLVLR